MASVIGGVITQVKALGPASTAAAAESEAASTRFSGAWKIAGALVAGYIVGSFLKSVGSPLDPNQDFGTASFKQKWQDAAAFAGNILTGNFGGALDQIKRPSTASRKTGRTLRLKCPVRGTR